MVRIVSALVLLQGLAVAAGAETQPAGLAQPERLVLAVPSMAPVVPFGVQFISTDRADVMQAIGQMQAQLTAFDPVLRDDAISVAARAFSQHWQGVVETHSQQQTGSLQDMIDDLRDGNAQSVTDFLNTPPMVLEPSMFSDSLFNRPNPFPVAGFFGS